ncbi:MAG: efflux RND transporter periplasmic adaptor subunit [Gammaproteobacteria bacterium]|nr:efflux RND transporter periplasmic adaptor subunit [Gammaproteobacteria bacterium]
MKDGAPTKPSAAKRVIAPALILAFSVVIFIGLINNQPTLKTTVKEPVPVAVRALDVRLAPMQLRVSSEGNVQPSVETKLVAQVAGEVIELSSSLVAGGNFSKGDILLKLDPRDYEIALSRSQATLSRAQAEQRFATEEITRIRSLYGDELVSIAELQSAERLLAVANAASDDAAAAVKRASVDLERTVFTAPFNGRVRAEDVDIGQFLSKGAMIATLYDTDRLQVRLPLADAQLAYLDPSYAQTGISGEEPANVVLTANYAGDRQSWSAKLLRTEGDISTKSRFLHVIVAVTETLNSNGVRLPVGLFVNAVIDGRTVDNLVSIPRTALRPDNSVMVIDDSDKLHFRDVSVFKLSDNDVLISEGLASGERISISPLQFVVEGMPVTVID